MACRGNVRAGSALIVLMACGSPRPSEYRPSRIELRDDLWRPVPQATGLEPLPADLPLLDLDPDPVDWRWPLAGPPQLAPSGAIAAMYGTAADWTTLCAMRRDPKGVDRDEALSYLRAWCDVPPDLVLAKTLAPLVKAKSSLIATAASIDIAAIVSLQMPATEALQWLGFISAREPLVLDALASSYLSADRPNDVRATIKLLDARYEFGSLKCRRLFREMFVTDKDRRAQIRRELAASNDAVCGRLSAHASCTLSWGAQAPGRGAVPARIDLERCTPILLDRPELGPDAYLTIAAAHWPGDTRSFDDWFAFATFAAGAAGAPRADELIAAAYTNAVRVSDCEGQLDQVHAAVALSSFPSVRRIGATTRAECARRQGSPPR